jgi:hypothetical protein
LIDLREAQERIRDGSIPNARFEPRGILEFWAAPDSLYYKTSFQAERRTVLLCAGGLAQPTANAGCGATEVPL